jgi:hypothetical protein
MKNQNTIINENQELTVKKTWMKPALQEEIAVNTESGPVIPGPENATQFS